MGSELRAFHGDPAIKERYLLRVRAHQRADEIIKGQYWEEDDEDGLGRRYRGCAVGCTIHGEEHDAYQQELGIPRALAYAEDFLFEAMEMERARAWPADFLTAIPVGADLSAVAYDLALWLIADDGYGLGQYTPPADRAHLPALRTLLETRRDHGEDAAAQAARETLNRDLYMVGQDYVLTHPRYGRFGPTFRANTTLSHLNWSFLNGYALGAALGEAVHVVGDDPAVSAAVFGAKLLALLAAAPMPRAPVHA